MTEPSTPADLPLVQLAADGTVGYCDPESGTCTLPDASTSAMSHEAAKPNNGCGENGDELVEYRPTH